MDVCECLLTFRRHLNVAMLASFFSPIHIIHKKPHMLPVRSSSPSYPWQWGLVSGMRLVCVRPRWSLCWLGCWPLHPSCCRCKTAGGMKRRWRLVEEQRKESVYTIKHQTLFEPQGLSNFNSTFLTVLFDDGDVNQTFSNLCNPQRHIYSLHQQLFLVIVFIFDKERHMDVYWFHTFLELYGSSSLCRRRAALWQAVRRV